ncbi:MAG: TolC family protein [Bacteroidales bacterium]|nr:TolC family protein [Bacteroidales bacterium]
MKRILFLPITVILMSWAASGQTHSGPWTLAECIRHAQENNLTLQQTELQVKQREIQLETAKGSRLPMVSGSASENFSFGRGLTADNTYSNTNTTSTGFSLGTSVPVFQGLRISNGIKENELGLKAATADLQKAREDMSVSVAQAYTQILYNMELLDVALNQVGIDSLQMVRLEALLENGKASTSQVAQQKAALGQSRLSATQARNNLNISLLDLSQLLELPDPEGFSIVRPNVPIDGILLGNPEDIYAEAIQNKPAVKAEMFRLDATEFSIKSAKGAFLPSLSASGGIGTNYYTMSAAPSAVFFDQIKNNFSQYLGLSLSVPIFSGFQNRNQVRSAELARTNQRLLLENTKKSLYKEIQQAYYNAVAASEKYRSSVDAQASARESFELVQAKYENGKANITEFNESRDTWLRAESDLVRSRYEYLYSAKLLDFYRGRPMEF